MSPEEFHWYALWISECHFPSYELHLQLDGRGECYLYASYIEEDVNNLGDLPKRQTTRRWFISPKMSKSEVIQTAFKCIMTSMEHRVREWFLYKGARVFGPHFNIEDLVNLCNNKPEDKRSQ